MFRVRLVPEMLIVPDATLIWSACPVPIPLISNSSVPADCKLLALNVPTELPRTWKLPSAATLRPPVTDCAAKVVPVTVTSPVTVTGAVPALTMPEIVFPAAPARLTAPPTFVMPELPTMRGPLVVLAVTIPCPVWPVTSAVDASSMVVDESPTTWTLPKLLETTTAPPATWIGKAAVPTVSMTVAVVMPAVKAIVPSGPAFSTSAAPAIAMMPSSAVRPSGIALTSMRPPSPTVMLPSVIVEGVPTSPETSR